MSKYTINITLTDAEEVAMQNVAIDRKKPVALLFQEFWDGYTSEEIEMTGAIKAQVLQWIADDVKIEIAKMTDAEALAKLKG